MNCCLGTGGPAHPSNQPRQRDHARQQGSFGQDIDRVAKELGENVDWLHEVADEMDTEDGVIWVYGDTDDGVMAFTDFGMETLSDLIEMHKEDPSIRERRSARK